MSKLSRLPSLSALLALTVLASACNDMQPPSPDQTATSAGAGRGPYNIESPVTPIGSSGENINANELPGRDNGLLGNFDFDNPPAEDIVVTVYFDFDQFNIKASERAKIEVAAKKIAADPSARLVAVGHTDWYGSDQYNLVLSDRRANSVKTYAGKSGASAAQIEILARGKIGATPDVKKDSPQAQHDRRVDLVKVPADATLPAATPAAAPAAAAVQ